ncbi:hypothetical protein [Streptomyces sp. Ag109_O5-1]|uniref:hypothetical protein n=1 Tax=Streptomyces sp. Ag109_O5-1 TaxID=1938851 RepID=UPI000F4D3B4E|nr:hypothetical protein [Streptomyces sp. Ag109_O5-1]
MPVSIVNWACADSSLPRSQVSDRHSCSGFELGGQPPGALIGAEPPRCPAREALTRQILQCRDEGKPGSLKLIEGDETIVPEATGVAEQDLAGLVLVPWIACTRCGQILMRAHARESWGDLSYLAQHYVITTANRVTVSLVFPAGSADAAFTSFQRACAEAP